MNSSRVLADYASNLAQVTSVLIRFCTFGSKDRAVVDILDMTWWKVGRVRLDTRSDHIENDFSGENAQN